MKPLLLINNFLYIKDLLLILFNLYDYRSGDE